MPTSNSIFHTATIEHQVPGDRADMAAVAYNLQYTKPVVDEFVAGNPPAGKDLHAVTVREHELIRANLYGHHPTDRHRRICVIGVADEADRATDAAGNAWFDYHASILFTATAQPDHAHKLAIPHRIPGVPTKRATPVGVAYDLHYLRPQVEAALARNAPAFDECLVVESGDFTLMRVNLYGLHPLERGRQVCVGGIADRHYRGVAAAEQAWSDYHTSLLFAAQALASR